MFEITGKKAGIIWDAKNDRPLIKFVDGKATTTDEAVAIRLRDMGFAVEGDITNPLLEMTVAELKAYASEKGIDLEGASKKKDIITIIQKYA